MNEIFIIHDKPEDRRSIRAVRVTSAKQKEAVLKAAHQWNDGTKRAKSRSVDLADWLEHRGFKLVNTDQLYLQA